MAAPDDPNKDEIRFIPHRTVQPVVASDDTRVDSDRDWMSDEDEKAWGTDPNNADTDGDGINDFDEIGSNLDPLVDETATPEASRGAALDFLADPYKQDAIQGDLEAAKKIAAIYGQQMSEAEQQQYRATGGAPLRSIERQRQLLGGEGGPSDPREQARWAAALENYKKALGGDPTAYVEMQQQLTGVRPSDHDLAIFIRGGGVPVLAMERQFQLLGAEATRPKEHIARLQALQEQVDKALGGDAKALDVVGAAFGMDRGELTQSTLASMGGFVKGIVDPTKFTPGETTLPGAPQLGGSTNQSGAGNTSGSGTGDVAGAPDDAGIDRGRPLEVGVQRGGIGDANTPGQGDGAGHGTAPPPAAETPPPTTPAPSPAPAPVEDDSPTAGGSRGDGGGSSLPGGIGPLPTAPNGSTPSPSGPSRSTGSAPSNTGGVVDDVDFDATEVPAGNPASWPYITGQPVKESGGNSPGADAGSGDAGAGTTDTDSDNEPVDDTSDDAADDVPHSDDTSDTATAYVNPDADSGGGWSLGDTGGRAFVEGGGFTDGGRDDLGGVDLSGVTISDRRDLFAHHDPDAGGSDGGLVEVPIVGGGFTDVVRPELAQIDLAGLTPRTPHVGTDAFGADTGDGSPDGAGSYAPGVAGGDSSAFAVGFDSSAISLGDNSFGLDQVSFQLDDFAARGTDMDLPAPGGDQMGDPDGDGLPFP